MKRNLIALAIALSLLLAGADAHAAIVVKYPSDHPTKPLWTEYLPAGSTLNCSSGPFTSINVDTTLEADPNLPGAMRVVGAPGDLVDGRPTLTLVADGVGPKESEGANQTCWIRGDFQASGTSSITVQRKAGDTSGKSLLIVGAWFRINGGGQAAIKVDVVYNDLGWVFLQNAGSHLTIGESGFGVTRIRVGLAMQFHARADIGGLVHMTPDGSTPGGPAITAGWWIEDGCTLNAEGLGWSSTPGGWPSTGWLDPASAGNANGRASYIAPAKGGPGLGLLMELPTGWTGINVLGGSERLRIGTRNPTTQLARILSTGIQILVGEAAAYVEIPIDSGSTGSFQAGRGGQLYLYVDTGKGNTWTTSCSDWMSWILMNGPDGLQWKCGGFPGYRGVGGLRP